MKILIAIILGMVSPVLEAAGEAAGAAERLAWLRKHAAAITEESGEAEVKSALGQPESTRINQRRRLATKTLHYLYYTDDAVHRSFSVTIHPGGKCEISQLDISREELRKQPLRLLTGTVETFYPDYPVKGGDGFLCHVVFKLDGDTHTVSLAVATKNRVKGILETGATVRVEHRNADFNFIFTDSQSLYLDSLVFTAKEAPTAPPAPPAQSPPPVKD